MKKNLAIISIVIVAAAIGLHQHSRLEALTEQARTTESGGGQPTESTPRIRADRSQVLPPAQLTLSDSRSAEIRSIMRDIAAIRMNPETGGPSGPAAAELYKRLQEAISGINHKDAIQLLADCKTDASLPDEIRNGALEVVCDLLRTVNPKEAFLFALASDDTPDRKGRLSNIFHSWATEDPNGAQHWYNAESKKSDEIASMPEMVRMLAIAQARGNPDRAIELAINDSSSGEPNSSTRSGSTIATKLRSAVEHQAFLAALRRAEGKSPGSQTLAEIRSGYIQQVSGELFKWPIDEALSLTSELRPEERDLVIEQISHRGDLTDRDKWATWLSKLDLPPNTRHPLHTLITGWAHADPITAGKWLEQAPAGDLKNQAVVEYAFQLADSDPATAARWASSLPQGAQRTKILRQVLQKWRANDSSSAATYAAEHGLPE